MLHGLHARSAVQDGIEETNVENVNHTPGPWEALGLTIAESAGQHRDIAECFSCHEHTVEISEPEAEANARLIAAAPELCASLEHVRDFLLIVANEGANQVFLERNAREMIAKHDALLAKARGDGGQGPGAPKVR